MDKRGFHLKIIFFSGYFIPQKGGYINNILELSQRFIQKIQQVTIVTANTHGYPEEETLNGIRVIRLPCWHILNETYPIIKPNIKTFRLLYKLFRDDFNIVSTQTRFFVPSFIGFIFAKLKRIRLIHTERGSVHSIVDSKLIYFISHVIDHTIGTLIVRFASHNVGVSQAACQFLKHLGAKKITYIPNGIDSNFYKKIDAVLRSKLNIDDNKLVITFVGRLIYAKGVQDLINVLKELQERYQNIKLIIVGAGNYKSSLELLSKNMGLQKDILFAGEKNKEEIVELLSISDIFVNPSYSEGLPTSVLEAASVGLPIIATDVGGTKEIVENEKTGFLITPMDITALEKALRQLIDNPGLRTEMGQRSRESVKERFNWDTITEQYLELFERN